jgi:hypothetical protein
MAVKSLNADPAVETPDPRRHTFREQVAGTVKVILLTGGLLGGLWLLQMIAKS